MKRTLKLSAKANGPRFQRGKERSAAKHDAPRRSSNVVLYGFAIGVAIGAVPAQAQEGAWQRRHLGVENGAPPSMRALAQTPDGLLWVTALDGLYRFDGVRFERMPPSFVRPIQSVTPIRILAEPDGTLWLGHDWGGLSVLHGGKTIPVTDPKLDTIFGLVRGADGSSWAVSQGASIARFAKLHGSRWATVATFGHEQGYWVPPVVDRTGRLWLIKGAELWTMDEHAREFHSVLRSISLTSGLTLGPDGYAWLASHGTLRRVSLAASGALLEGPALPASIPSDQFSNFMFASPRVLWQFSHAGKLTRYEFSAPVTQDRLIKLVRTDELATDPTTALMPSMLLDREGSLWVVTSQGLDQYRRTSFITLPELRSTKATNFADPLVLQAGDDVWIRMGGKLFRDAGDGSLQLQTISVPATSTPCVGRRGGVWIATGHGRAVLAGGAAPRSVSLAGTRLFDKQPFSHCAEDGAGNLWVHDGNDLRVIGRGGTKLVSRGSETGRPIAHFAVDPEGRVIGYVGRGSLWRFDGGNTQSLWPQRDVTLGFAEFMYQGPSYLLMGGDRGLVRYNGQRFQTLSAERFPYLAFVAGAVQTATGDTWLQTVKGVVRMRTADLDHAFADPTFSPPIRIFTEGDGLPGATTYLDSNSLAADRAGHVWAVTTGGVARFDPGAETVNRLAPSVLISTIRADGETIRPNERNVLPRPASRIAITFMATSYVDPLHVQVRYRLQGVDKGWITAGGDRDAVYTNLRPGAYRFQVIAANSDGVWNTTGADTTIVVPARFYQTKWFLALCLVVGAFCIWAAYKLRVAAISRGLRKQAAERAHEREKIARDLHDTLLQGIQGLVLMFQAVTTRMSPGDSNRQLLQSTLDRADKVIADGKERVLDLRSTDHSVDLVDLINALLSRTPFGSDVRAEMIVLGTPNLVAAKVGREVSDIVSEALFNAARHSGGTHVIVKLEFGENVLDISVSDNGVGMPSTPRRASQALGFGLMGMQERAAEIGGTLRFEDRAEGGTLVRLRVERADVFMLGSKRDWRERLQKGYAGISSWLFGKSAAG